MGRAFQCDDCERMFARSPDIYVTVDGEGLVTDERIELCIGCAVMRFDGLVTFEDEHLSAEVCGDE